MNLLARSDSAHTSSANRSPFAGVAVVPPSAAGPAEASTRTPSRGPPVSHVTENRASRGVRATSFAAASNSPALGENATAATRPPPHCHQAPSGASTFPVP